MERLAAVEAKLEASRQRLVALSLELKRLHIAMELLAQAVQNISNAISAYEDQLPGERPVMHGRSH